MQKRKVCSRVRERGKLSRIEGEGKAFKRERGRIGVSGGKGERK